MAHRNRWFTELKNGWIFHGYVSHNQRVTVQPAKRINTHTFLVLRYVGQSGRQKHGQYAWFILALLLWMTSATPKKLISNCRCLYKQS